MVQAKTFIQFAWLIAALGAAAGCNNSRTVTIHDMQVRTIGTNLDLAIQIDADPAVDQVELFVSIEAPNDGQLVYAQPVKTVDLRTERQWYEIRLDALKVQLWAPHTPRVYEVRVDVMKDTDTLASGVAGVAFGSIKWVDGHVRINGQRTFLRAIEIDVADFPPLEGERAIRRFATPMMKDLRKRNLNAVRLLNAERTWRVVAQENGLVPLAAQTPTQEVVIDPASRGEPTLGFLQQAALPDDAPGILLRPVLHNDMPGGDAAIALTTRLAIEHSRRSYLGSNRIAGVLPSGKWFDVPTGAGSFKDCRPTAALEQLTQSMQAVLVSWDFWSPHIYAGAQSPTLAHLINQQDDGQTIDAATLVCELVDPRGAVVSGGTIELSNLPNGYAGRAPIMLDVPADAVPGQYQIRTTLRHEQQIFSTGVLPLTVQSRNWARLPAVGKRASVIDPSGATQGALRRLGVKVQQFNAFDFKTPLVVHAGQWKTKAQQWQAVARYAANGGRVLLLQPNSDAMKYIGIPLREASMRKSLAVGFADAKHAAFDGINTNPLLSMTDPQPARAAVAGQPRVHPVTAGLMTFGDQSQVEPLATYGNNGDSVALARWTTGKGSIVISGLDLVSRSGADPIADRLLANLVKLVSGK